MTAIAEQFWKQRQANYPYQICLKQAGSPRPHEVSTEAYGQFLSCPFPSIKLVRWGFQSQQAADDFAASFQNWVIKDPLKR